MSFIRNIYLTVSLLCIIALQGYSQSYNTIGGTINKYTSIETLLGEEDSNVDSLIVGSVAEFGVGDTVMVYVVKGAEINTTWEDGRDGQQPGNTGRYAFLIITEIDVPSRLVVLNSNLPLMTPFGDEEVAQLIRVPSYRWASVSAGGVSAKEWDGATGGVVAMFVHQTLRLNGNIDVTGTGFRGAKGSEDGLYDGNCSSVDPDEYDSTFYVTDNTIRAGLKGEGTTEITFDKLRGKGKNINGGGGGNARLSGGGGGSNHTAGGKGGEESTQLCESAISAGGLGGFDLGRAHDAYYVNENPLNRGFRIFYGGGGGTGTRVSGRITTDGGDGGGLVVIIADTIEGNGRSIIADGEDVTINANGAAGGGGGGGGIVLDVSGYKTTLNLSASGGNGGNTNHAIDTTGPGGGGGGGFYWLAGSSQPGVNADLLTEGKAGSHLSPTPIKHGAGDGGLPMKINDLETPLRGFLFNTVPEEFTVCSDILPDPIYASKPKGGDGTYSYQWIDSTSSHTWQLSTLGTNNQQHFTFNQKLSDSTWFRRIVTSASLPADTSYRIAYNVHPAITFNLVSATDTVCSGGAPELFVPSATIGGGLGPGSYTYLWKKDEGGTGTYLNADNANTGSSYQAPGLTVTTNFARIAYSGVCVDTSDALLVKVWEKLTGNDITPFDTICYNTVPDQISGPVPGQGDPSDRRYLWESTLDTAGSWSTVPEAKSTSYQAPALTQTTWYRRVVLSGSDDACVDRSDPVEILNIPLITGNSINGTHTVCTNDQASLLTGSGIGGGYNDQYSYLWQSRTESTEWGPAPLINNIQTGYNAGIMDGDTTFFRRIVGSGGYARNVCLDTSNVETINVLPSITNNLIETGDIIKCQWEFIEDLTQNKSGGNTPGGGATQGGVDPTRIYRWEVANGIGSPGVWQVIDGATGIDYSDNPQLELPDDYYYRRIVYSGPAQVCKDTSNLVQITVHTEITDNTLVGADSVCFADTKELKGVTPSGEPGISPVYTWRDLDGGNDIPGSDMEQYISGPYNILGKYNYERIVSIGECTDTSNALQITVMELPGGNLTDAGFTACEKDTVMFVDLNIDDLNTYVTPWEVLLSDGVNPELIGPFSIMGDGNLDVQLGTEQISEQFTYEIASIVYNSSAGNYSCSAPAGNLSGSVPVNVFLKPEPEIMVDNVARDSFKVCGTDVTMNVDADHGAVSWTFEPAGMSVTPDPHTADLYYLSIPDVHGLYGKYFLTFRSDAGDCFGMDSIDIHFFEQPEDAYAGVDTMVFLKNSVRLNADAPTAGTGTWTYQGEEGTVDFTDENDPKTWVYGLKVGEANEFLWTITNGEDEGTCITSSDVSIVTQSEVFRFNGFSPGNGDAENEYLIMRGMRYADEFSISFFNSLGKTVRTINQDNVDDMEINESLIFPDLRDDERVVWDGKADNGHDVPSGTYYYVMSLVIKQRDADGNVTSEDSYDYKDYVVLIRE